MRISQINNRLRVIHCGETGWWNTIINDVGEQLTPTCFPSVQPETSVMQFQVMSSKAGTGWPSEEFLKGKTQGAVE